MEKYRNHGGIHRWIKTSNSFDASFSTFILPINVEVNSIFFFSFFLRLVCHGGRGTLSEFLRESPGKWKKKKSKGKDLFWIDVTSRTLRLNRLGNFQLATLLYDPRQNRHILQPSVALNFQSVDNRTVSHAYNYYFTSFEKKKKKKNDSRFTQAVEWAEDETKN